MSARVELGAGFCIFKPDPEQSRRDNQAKKLGAELELESDFKVVFQAVVIVDSKTSSYFCNLEMEYQNT